MPSFKKEELMAASDLRTLSQRELFHRLEGCGKLGILYKDNLTAVLLPHDRYISIITRLRELEEAAHEHVAEYK
ncbi:hypothetical protein [Alicyclobacillus ferrooxydans]|uniref:Prevent-host-death protein n=1 Tax=Alicyclobacillus ferrooxydans TaxID=471514 RepID=A0A0P9EK42_9BACL|nr:hypothetical protein [Alicyclobacillus ferrooxydans]KPV43424.1 hypothetical protein AN477_12570 [Alicyclobacillus ferrooxydans]